MSEKDFENVPCKLCESDNFEKVASKGQFDLPANVVVCRVCGLTYLNPRWTKQSYLKFYQKEYDNFYRPKIGSVRSNTGPPVFDRLSKFCPDLKVINSILEVGSGDGENLIFLKNEFSDAELFAIEPSEIAVKVLRGSGVSLIARDIDGDWESDYQGKFDLIIMRHVLEHVSDPVTALSKLRSTLTANGRIYVAVPNNMTPVGNLKGYWFRAVHTFYYSRATLTGILRKSGLSPAHIQEGDQHNQNELFAFASKAATFLEPEISQQNFVDQISVLNAHERSQNSLKIKIKRAFRSILKIMSSGFPAK